MSQTPLRSMVGGAATRSERNRALPSRRGRGPVVAQAAARRTPAVPGRAAARARCDAWKWLCGGARRNGSFA